MPKYNDDILNYYHDDTHIGSFDQNEKNVGTGLVGAPYCGDVMKLQIKVGKNNNGIEYIEDAKILVFGCGSAKASSSYAAKKIIGMSLEDAKKVKNTDIANALDLPKLKLHCSVLVEEAIKKAINDYKDKQNNATSTKNEIEQTNNNNKDDFYLKVDDEAIVFTAEQLKQVEKNKKIKINGIRLSLEEGNCGLIYKVRYIEDKENVNKDIVFIAETTDKTYKIKIFVSNNMKKILNGTHISYKEENLKRGLVFTNPKETGRCHCGKNFYIDKKTKKKDTECK